MPKRCELIEGEKRNRLTYVKEAEPYISLKGGKFRQIFVTCECSPDKEYIIRLDEFFNNKTKSCGCWNIEKLKERTITHGKSNTRIYNIYLEMKRWGITHGYDDNLTIDRIDNNGNYEPNNCQWITRGENTAKRNKEYIQTENKYLAITPEGEDFIFSRVKLISEKYNLDISCIYKVLNGKRKMVKGWKFKKIENKIQEAI